MGVAPGISSPSTPVAPRRMSPLIPAVAERVFLFCYTAAMQKDAIEAKIAEIEAAMALPDFWSDKDKAQAAVKEYQDLKAQLELAAKPFKIDVEVVDILRDKANLEFKRDSEAKVAIKNGELIIDRFYPMNLLQKLSLNREAVKDWRELVESILIDWNYDGAVLQPTLLDIPAKETLVQGRYTIPDDAGTIRVIITDLLSESWEGSFNNG